MHADSPHGVAVAFFVYGTLMPGHPAWPELAPYATTWGPATAQGWLWDTGHGYPAARFHRDGGPIAGVRVAVAPAVVGRAIVALDRFENEGVLYRRVEVQTSAGPAMGYEWLGPTRPLLALAGAWAGEDINLSPCRNTTETPPA